MRQYKVTKQCYVPMGSGMKYKNVGQLVMLSADDAAGLAGYVVPVDDPGAPKVVDQVTVPVGGQKLTPHPGVPDKKTVEPPKEVSSDGGASVPADERAGSQD